jgi:hypothetical protein
MNRRSPQVMLSLAAVVLSLSACSQCKQTGSISMYTLARSDAKGPWSNGVLVVNGRGFSPHKRIDLKFANLPVDATQRHSWSTDQPLAPVTNADGSFTWSLAIKSSNMPTASWDRYVASLPPLDYSADANHEVTVTAKEHWSSCVAQTTIKADILLHPVFAGAAPDSSAKP